MAGFKKQIIERFKVKFPTVTLSKKRLESIADRLDAKTDDEEAIDGQLDALNELMPFSEIQKADDKIRDLQTKISGKGKESENEDEPEAGKDKGKEKPDADQPPVWFKEWSEKQEQRLAAMEGEKTITNRKTVLSDLLKDATESYRNKAVKDFGRMKFETDEEFEEFLADAKSDLEAHVQEVSNSGLGADRPMNGKGGKLADKDVSPAMQQLIADRKAEAEAKTPKTV